MAEKESEQEFNGEDFKRMLRFGAKFIRNKGAEAVAAVQKGINPDERMEKYLQRMYDRLIQSRISPEQAKDVIIDHVRRLLDRVK